MSDNKDVPMPEETISPQKRKKEPTTPIAPKISSSSKSSAVVLSEPGTPTIKLPVSPTKDSPAASHSPSPKPKLSPSKSSSVESQSSSPKAKLSPSKIVKSDISPKDEPSTSKAWLLPSEGSTDLQHIPSPKSSSSSTTFTTEFSGSVSLPSTPRSVQFSSSISSTRQTTPTPLPSSPMFIDPAIAKITPNQEVIIEIDCSKEVPGIALLGGSDTFVNGPAAVILDIYEEGAIDKDGRLKVGDQIRECNDVVINKDMSYESVCMSIKPRADKMNMIVYRPQPLEYLVVQVELKLKSKQPWGTLKLRQNERGVYISEIDYSFGSTADPNRQLQRGDFLLAVDGKDVSKHSVLNIEVLFSHHKSKSIAIQVKRFKIIPKEEPS